MATIAAGSPRLRPGLPRCDRLKNEAPDRAYTPSVADSRYQVEVDVSLGRPPRVDATIYYQVAAHSPVDAQLIACQMAACHPRVVMPVGSRVVGLGDQPA